ncbi:hypothetical protein VNI00_005326 [Paramarasmius palmivorus]|uniref:Uncharacterized protein n=1 Tax=Paramarasmius palmivorus TaxID=297713 RepID=A0AAW0DDL7_9AGAR
MAYFTRSYARLINTLFPESTESGLSSGGLVMEELVSYRHRHQHEQLCNKDPEVLDEDLDGSYRLEDDEVDAALPGFDASDGGYTSSDVDASATSTASSAESEPAPPRKKKKTNKRLHSQPPASSRWIGPSPPAVPYERFLTPHFLHLARLTSPLRFDSADASLLSTGSIRRDKRRLRSMNRHGKGLQSEAYVPQATFLDITKDARASGPMWSGLNVGRDARQLIASQLNAGKVLPDLAPVPYEGKETKITDGNRRLVIFRSAVTSAMKKTMPSICQDVDAFMSRTTAPTDKERERNLRGGQWFCIAGYDRNNKPIPKISRWHAAQKQPVDQFFKKGRPFHYLTNVGCSLLQKNFPGIYRRFLDCSEWMLEHHRLKAPYGVFFNFCLNGTRHGIERVHCKPHVDFKNVALGVCMVYVYGHFNHRERSWLVIWEAGIVLELPPGVFVLYPSSLFLHFNVDRSNFVVTNGDEPNACNSQPLCDCDDPHAVHDESWDSATGRGSIVWFNQATMFQTSELGFPTVKAAKSAGIDASCAFPVDNAFESLSFSSVHNTSLSSLRAVDVVEDDQIDNMDGCW